MYSILKFQRLLFYLIYSSLIVVIGTNNNNRHCFNDIFDAIFILSIPSRIESVAKVLHQFEKENIKVNLWRGYSDDTPNGMQLWQTFRNKCRVNPSIRVNKNSPYKNYHAFAIRQGQLDIIKYAKSQNYSNVLIFEDDIILTNSKYLDQFCRIHHDLPKWDVLTIGNNQEFLFRSWPDIQTIDNHKNEKVGFYHRTETTWGGYGWAISSSSAFDLFINAFDVNVNKKDCTNLPIDAFTMIPEMRYSLNSINYIPSLVIPKVDYESSHTRAWDQKSWLNQHTFLDILRLGISNHFSNNWWLLDKDSILKYNQAKRQEILKLFNESVSNAFLY